MIFAKTIITAVLLLSFLQAQAPDKMSYQAVVRDNEGKVVVETDVSMKINILLDSVTGEAVYAEKHSAKTNSNGLLSIQIGNGDSLAGSFKGINWANGKYYVQTEIDPKGGEDYSITGTSQILSVPYALHAKTASRGVLVEHTNTGHNSEKITSVPIPTGSPFTMSVLYSQKFDNLVEGEVLVVMAQWEATILKTYNVMMGGYAVLGDSPTWTKLLEAREISEANAYNIDKNMHHGIGSIMGTYSVPAELTGTRYVNIIVYAASDAAAAGDKLKIEQDYGRLSVLRFKP
ncbi:MAG: hypothetical protein HQK83_19555 [Fibrobacteria bacterium]|nr:hypothetical protein [Fibrobacteria bacterium]